MIYYVTGPLGHGKSLYACRKIADALLHGRVVATNIRLREGWEHEILRHAPYYRFAGREKKAVYRAEVGRRYAYVDDLPTLIGARLHGVGENRGLRVIDEAHNELNNREWVESNQKLILRKMTLSRKRGWETYVIAQNKDNTDAALRRVAAVEIRLVNWRRFLFWPYFRTPILPFDLFLAQAFPLNVPANLMRSTKPLFREQFLLGWQRKLYDTMQDYDTPDEEGSEDALWLPSRLPGAHGGTPQGGSPGAGEDRTEGSNGSGLSGGREPQGVAEVVRRPGVTVSW